jgi:hypothetical protein
MKLLNLLPLVCIVSCTKEQTTLSDTFAKNTTSHNIQIRLFKNGAIDNNVSFNLQPNETKKIYYNNTRGIGNGVTYGRINQPADSFIVTFDNLYSIAHYKPTLIGNSTKKYLYSSKRNLYNDSSYMAALTNSTKYSRKWEFTYIFVEQDYIDAR